jgi:phosphatidylglycerophosphatase A
MKTLTKIYISIFYIGYIKYAPGTWGSLASILILYPIIKLSSIPLIIFVAIFFFLLFISNFFINYFSLFTNSLDSKRIVIDEFLGIFTIFLFYNYIFIYNDFFTLTLIFFFFRLFDITKVFPLNYIDKKFKNGYGVIFDDIFAGIYTILTMVTLNAFI